VALFDKVKFWKKKEPPKLPSTPVPRTSSDPLAPSKDTHPPSPFNETPNPFEPQPHEKSPFETGHGQFQTPGLKDPDPLSMGPIPQPPQSPQKDMQLIQLKLDAIKTTLETISLRLERLEQAAGIERR